MYKGNMIALEDIDNYSICVLTNSGIRKMSFEEDIEEQLVYVNNVPKITDGEAFTVKKGEYVRYLHINISPKTTI